MGSDRRIVSVGEMQFAVGRSAGVEKLAAVNLTGLQRLDLSSNNLGAKGVEKLAALKEIVESMVKRGIVEPSRWARPRLLATTPPLSFLAS